MGYDVLLHLKFPQCELAIIELAIHTLVKAFMLIVKDHY
jgi:hypothetical protein